TGSAFLDKVCFTALPVVTCLKHVYGPGQSEIYVQDPVTMVFEPPAGSFSTIVREEQFVTTGRTVRGAKTGSTAPVYLLRARDGLLTGFDGEGRLLTKRDPAGSVVNFIWSRPPKSSGRAPRITAAFDPWFRPILFYYDQHGRLVSAIAPDGRRVTYTHSPLEQLHPAIDTVTAAAFGLAEGSTLPGRIAWQSTLTDVDHDAEGRSESWHYGYAGNPLPDPGPAAPATGALDCGAAGERLGDADASARRTDQLYANLTRVERNGVVILTTQYDEVPGSPTFDRVLTQRFGALLEPANAMRAPARFEYVQGVDAGARVPAPILAELGVKATPPGLCPQAVLEIVLGRPASSFTCASRPFVAGLPERPALPPVNVSLAAERCNDTWGLHYGKVRNPGRDALLAADLGQACQWTHYTNRAGEETWTGLNFIGQPVIEAVQASPGETPGWFVSLSTYTADGQLAALRATDGRIISRGYDDASPSPFARGNVLSVTERSADGALSRNQSFTYEPLYQQLSTARDARDQVTRYDYDYQEQDAGSAASWLPGYLRDFGASTPDLAAAAPGITFFGSDLNADGRKDRTMGTLVRLRAPTATLASGASQDYTETYRHNEFGQLIERRAPAGRLTRYFYNTSTDPLGRGDGEPTSAFLRQLSGLQVNARLATGGRLRRTETLLDQSPVAAPVTLISKLTYDRFGSVASIDDDRGRVTRLTSNGFHDVTEATDPAGYTTRLTRDARGNVVRSERTLDLGAGGRVAITLYDYSRENQLTRLCVKTEAAPAGQADDLAALEAACATRGPRAAVWSFEYDLEDRLIRTTDPEGGVTAQTTNTRGLALGVVRGQGSPRPEVSSFRYDAAGRLLTLTDAAAETATWTYDGLGRTATVTAPNGTVTTLGYDLDDNLTSSSVRGADGRGGTGLLSEQRFTYDERGRMWLSESCWLSPTSTPQVGKVDWTSQRAEFDPHGHPLSVEQLPSGVRWTTKYDSLGGALQSTDPAGVVISSSFDPAAFTSTLHILGEGANHSVITQLDPRGLPIQSTRRGGALSVSSSVVLDGDGLPSTSTDPTGNVSTMTRDLRGLVLRARAPRVERGQPDLVS
ncbi:MAG: RHS repeat protein, partial [Deltaproteobacteria bacterium]|nr:RHS repeat protein [Deltaproteobacteria bacterium]